jgi:hypothetical protein
VGATNSTITEMHGCLCNVCFTFDNIDIYLHVSCQTPPMTSSLAAHSTPSQNASPRTLLNEIST